MAEYAEKQFLYLYPRFGIGHHSVKYKIYQQIIFALNGYFNSILNLTDMKSMKKKLKKKMD